MKKLLALSLLSSTCFASPYIPKADVEVHDFYAANGIGKYVFSHNCAQVENQSDRAVTIEVQYNLCVELAQCDNHYWKVKVNPHATWHDCYNPTVGKSWPTGHWNIASETIIYGKDIELFARKTGSATLHVS